jgi:hypothetical protein
MKLKANYKEQVANLIHSDKTMTISNHSVVNLTGRNIVLQRVFKRKGNFYSKKLCLLEPNKSYDIEFFDDENEDIEPNDIALNLVRDNYISFDFENYKISENLIKIDNIQLKTHRVNYLDMIKKYKLSISNNSLEYIISEVRYNDLRKYVYFYSPLVFKNKTRMNIYIKLIRKELPDLSMVIQPKGNIGIPFEYLDGVVQFGIHEDMQYNRGSDVKTFLLHSFDHTEMKIKDIHLNFVTDSLQNRKRNYISVNISSTYILRNCLPFDMILEVFFEDGRKSRPYDLPKSEKIYIDMLAMHQNLVLNMKCLEFSNSKPITLFDVSKFRTGSQKNKTEKDVNSLNNYIFNTSFILNDEKGLPVKLYTSLVDYAESRVLVIYSNSIIIDNTLMNLKFFYSKDKNKFQEIAGQKDSVHKNILMHSDEKFITIKYNNVASEPQPINTVGISSIVECRNMEAVYEFNLSTNLSLVAKDLELYSVLVSISPRFVIYNNLKIPILLCLHKGNSVPETIIPNEKRPYYFCGMTANSLVCLRPIEEDENLHYHSGSKWNWSLPISLINSGLMTIQISGIRSFEKKYINMEKKIEDNTTFVILNEADYTNAQFIVENYSSYISMKIYQQNYELSPEYLNIKSRCMYAWSDYNDAKIMNIEFLIGDITDRPLCPKRNIPKSYEILDDRIIIDGEGLVYPVNDIINIKKDSYSGYLVKMEIFTDGMKKTIRFTDHKLINVFNKEVALNYNPNENSKYHVTEVNLKIQKLGISLISDNRFIAKKNSSYNRYEVIYIVLNDIYYYNRTQVGDDESKATEMQLKIKSAQIDNEYAHLTYYPIILRYIEPSGDYQPPFFNLCITSYTNNPSESLKLGILNYLVQTFDFSIDSEVLEALFNFISNVTLQLKTSLTQVHPLFESHDMIAHHGINLKDDEFEPFWLSEKNVLGGNSYKIFIQTLETSPIEIIFSFNTQTKSKVIQKYITTNPFLSSLLSTVSNIEKAKICLNGSKLNNFYGNMNDLIQLIINHYSQAALFQVLKIISAIDVIGNPSNMISNFGTGFRDFFQKPMQGIIKGPLEGVKGVVDGGVSLIKHTAFGTFSATSKITGGLSRGLLFLTQDDKYLNEIERKRMLERSSNFVEGLGHGITSMVQGVFKGVTGVVTQPINETKKKGALGIVTGFFKGIGGLVTNPLVGGLEFISHTSEGIKNTITSESNLLKQNRKPRAFYGKFKYVRCIILIYRSRAIITSMLISLTSLNVTLSNLRALCLTFLVLSCTRIARMSLFYFYLPLIRFSSSTFRGERFVRLLNTLIF